MLAVGLGFLSESDPECAGYLPLEAIQNCDVHSQQTLSIGLPAHPQHHHHPHQCESLCLTGKCFGREEKENLLPDDTVPDLWHRRLPPQQPGQQQPEQDGQASMERQPPHKCPGVLFPAPGMVLPAYHLHGKTHCNSMLICLGPSGLQRYSLCDSMSRQTFPDTPCLEGYSEDAEPI